MNNAKTKHNGGRNPIKNGRKTRKNGRRTKKHNKKGGSFYAAGKFTGNIARSVAKRATEKFRKRKAAKEEKKREAEKKRADEEKIKAQHFFTEFMKNYEEDIMTHTKNMING